MTHDLPFKTLSVVGLGYIGLPTAAVFASRGVHVTGVDVNVEAVETINQGKIHIVEPELDMLVHAAVTEGRLRATTSAEPAEAFIIAVPTPFREDHAPDLSYIECASRAVARVLAPGNLVILESTSPVGATEKMAEWMAEERPDLTFPCRHGEASDIRIAHCPERVLPGHVIRELVENDRVIGGVTGRCAEAASALYGIIVEGEWKVTSVRTAEMCKLTENAFRDVNIAFANELSVICHELDINVWELIALANLHPRVNILRPGPGVGGHCIAVDPWFIISQTPDLANVIKTARTTNASKPDWILTRLSVAIEEISRAEPGKLIKVGVLGLAFKPDIDDLRESPAMQIALTLLENRPEIEVQVVEPNVSEVPRALGDLGASLVTVHEALAQCNVILVLVAHKEFIDQVDPIRSHRGAVIDAVGVIDAPDSC